MVLADSFERFFLETLDRALTSDVGKASESWGFFLVEALGAHRSFHSAERAFRSGYPLAGFVLLRDLKDRALFNAAVLIGISSVRALWGLGILDGSPEQAAKYRSLKKKEEFRVRKMMVGEDSGLDPSIVTELSGWEELFHSEVHGSRLTWASDFGPWIKGKEPLRLGPQLRESTTATYFNRATELGWMWLRLLPHLQYRPEGFGQDWERRWSLLDEAFARMERSLVKLGKPVAGAIETLIAAKFAFGPSARFAGPQQV